MAKSRRTGTLKETAAPTGPQGEDSALGASLLQLKWEAAQALGLWEKVEREGWGALTAAENGRIGGYITRLKWAEVRDREMRGSSPS
ncbi:MAG: small, acid-soluble spore protein, alpha/beta type [Firmicutes bacterium]|nr:small, acid-soluble spore protein, alpha/beta type [Bacillota bacterium]